MIDAKPMDFQRSVHLANSRRFLLNEARCRDT
jgi:hypothetical protein